MEQFLTLGEERMCHFLATSEEEGCLLLKTTRGDSHIVGVTVDIAIRGAPRAQREILVNPLDKMSPAEINRLWGIRLNCWPKGIEKRLNYVNADRVCITIGGSAAREGVDMISTEKGRKSFPLLPEKLRHLVVEGAGPSTEVDYSSLRGLRRLSFLILRGGTKEGFDIGSVFGSPSLRYLNLTNSRIINGEMISTFTGLRSLDIRRSRGLESIGFVRSMTQLTELGPIQA